ncbi:MAG TPA: adenine phosphoribosyltransferase [Gemmatimonadales bacterium]
MNLNALIRTIPDYPKPGILFRDITTLLKDPDGFRQTVDAFVARYRDRGITKVAGIEARGFILGGAVAHGIGAGFVPIRKRGKLPWDTIGHDYELEYGTDRVELHSDAVAPGEPVLLLDDLIATGGTAEAAVALLSLIGGRVIEAGFVIELTDLSGRRRLEDRGVPVFSLMDFAGH